MSGASDRHRENAARIFKCKPEEVTPEQRWYAKVRAFAMDYQPQPVLLTRAEMRRSRSK